MGVRLRPYQREALDAMRRNIEEIGKTLAPEYGPERSKQMNAAELMNLEADRVDAMAAVCDLMLSGVAVEAPIGPDPLPIPRQVFRRGRWVKVYDDPMTRERLQGWALLVKFINGCGWCKGYPVERWSVIFEDDDGTEVERSIWSAPEGVKK